jgi:hypothetical protein
VPGRRALYDRQDERPNVPPDALQLLSSRQHRRVVRGLGGRLGTDVLLMILFLAYVGGATYRERLHLTVAEFNILYLTVAKFNLLIISSFTDPFFSP